MPPREWRLRIEDILEAIHKIQRYVSGLSFDDFCADDQVVDAVVRNLQDDPVRRRPDITLAKANLHWEPTVPLRDGLSRTIDYFREHSGILLV